MTRPHVPHAVRAAHRDGIFAFVLAALVAVFFPVAASAGTETTVLRYTVAAVLAVAGAMLRAGGTTPMLFAGGLGLLAAAAFPLHAAWLAAFAVLCAIDGGVARLRDAAAARRTGQTAVPDALDDGESPSDIVESVAIAFVYALVVREFSCEAFKIPTESMNPTILGTNHGSRVGDQLLAAKAPLLFSEPKRWSIIVFRYPLFHPTNYIKRLVGLPREHLEIRDGDIYADGKVVAKPDDVQETLWFPVLPDRGGRMPSAGLAQAFRSDGGECRFDDGGATITAGKDAPAWIVHDNGTHDVRVSFDADASQLGDAGALLVRLDGGRRRVEFEARRDGVWLTAPGVARTQLADVPGLGASPSRWSFSVADRVVRVWHGGRLVARAETADEPNITSQREEAWMGVSGGTAHFGDIRIESDLHYSTRGGGKWDIPDGCYFMLGDNTNASNDSRAWQGNVFKLKDGREYICDINGVRLDDGTDSSPSIRTTPDGNAFEIWDSYGAHRFVAKSDLVGGSYQSSVPQPFVRREDLVGRAFFIFFPLKSEGTWRPRILP